MRSAHEWRRTLWLMVGVQLVMTGSFQISAPFLPLFIQGDMGIKPLPQVEYWTGAITAINSLTSALFAPFWGMLADRVGRKAMVIRSSVAVAVATTLMGISQNVWELFAARAAMGIFSGFTISAMALVSTQVPEENLGFALGWLATGQVAGTLLGPLVGGFIADHIHNYRAVFLISAVGVFAGTTLCTIFIREEFSRAAAPIKGEHKTSIWEQLRGLAALPSLAPMFMVILLAQVAAMGIQPVLPLFVVQLVGNVPWIATAAGGALAITGVAGVLSSPILGRRADKTGYQNILLISLAGTALFTIPQAWAGTLWVFLALRFGVGIFLGGILPTANAIVGRLAPVEQRGQVYGIVSSATFFGRFLGPVIGAAVAAHFGFPAVFITFGVLMLANLVYVALRVRGIEHTFAN
jgi:DHA1 family multidrug resistance protein-like MFS transporter